MSEKLEKGARIRTLYGEAVIDHWIAEGGQGDVYAVDYNGEPKALKWYKPTGMGKKPEAFYRNLKDNVLNGSPSKAFLWPLDITEWGGGENVFGYIMDLRPKDYYEVSDYMLTHVRFSSFRTVIDASLNIVSAYRLLHNRGYSYQDLNDGNFFINPVNGKVLICDNDNVAPNGVETGIIGKPRYMAPEIVVGQKMPDKYSDWYSMSVILFILFCLNHPLEGKRSLTPALTPALQKKLYGTEAMFLMDKENKNNLPDPRIHKNVLMVWKFLPDYMQELFSRAFGQTALKTPHMRPSEVEWMNHLVRFRSEIVLCQCGNEIFTKQGRTCVCEKCQRTLRIPYRLEFSGYSTAGIVGSRIYRCQVGPCNAEEALKPVGQVTALEKDGKRSLVLKNLSDSIWNATTPSGRAKRVGPKEGVPLIHGITITIHNETIRITENEREGE